jgi:hypothetical protein
VYINVGSFFELHISRYNDGHTSELPDGSSALDKRRELEERLEVKRG